MHPVFSRLVSRVSRRAGTTTSKWGHPHLQRTVVYIKAYSARSRAQILPRTVSTPVPVSSWSSPLYSSGNPAVVTARRLTEENLSQLLHNEIAVLHVPKFVSDPVCDSLTDFLWQSPDREQYTHEVYEEKTQPDGTVAKEAVHLYLGVDRVGVPFNSTYDKGPDSLEMQRYLQQAQPIMDQFRQVCDPSPSPTDQLRRDFHRLLHQGARVASLDGQQMFCGIGRLMRAQESVQSEEQPHFDSMPSSTLAITQQFSANFYLQVPDSGGELEIWNLPPLSYDDIATLDQSVDMRSMLPPDSIKVRPEKGDLLLFNTRRPHAIRAFSHGTRTSMQTFIGHKGDDQPIVLWN